MTKKEMVNVIAKAYFPPHYADDSAAVVSFKRDGMKKKKADLEISYNYALPILKQRELEALNA